MEHESPEPGQQGAFEENDHTLDQQFRYAQVGRSVNGVTHDINNFLGAAQAYAELVLMDRNLPPESRRMVSEIVASTVKCSQIVNAMTTIARPPERDTLNVVEACDVLTELEMLFTYTCRVARIRLAVERPDELPNILASAAKLTLALVYILWDTMDRMAGAGESAEASTLRVTCRMEERHLVFVIAHSGAPFYSELVTHWNGDGTGLAAAAEIARLHEGDLRYCPEQGYFLRFSRQLASHLAMK